MNNKHVLRGDKTDSDITQFDDNKLLELYLTLPKKVRNEQFISTAEAAELARVHLRTVQRWVESGYISIVRLGKRKLWIYKEDFIRYLKINNIDN